MFELFPFKRNHKLIKIMSFHIKLLENKFLRIALILVADNAIRSSPFLLMQQSPSKFYIKTSI